MDQLVDMSSKEKPMNEMMEGSEYPYNLRICLCHEDLEKLGIKILPELGTEMMLMASVKVVGKNERSCEEDEVMKSMDIQITAMCLKSAKAKMAVEKKLYEKSE